MQQCRCSPMLIFEFRPPVTGHVKALYVVNRSQSLTGRSNETAIKIEKLCPNNKEQ